MQCVVAEEIRAVFITQKLTKSDSVSKPVITAKHCILYQEHEPIRYLQFEGDPS